jgi:hypothetical protein
MSDNSEGSYLRHRLDKIEGMLARLLIQEKVNEKMVSRAHEMAQSALIEIRAYKESIHEVKYVNRDVYEDAFGNSTRDENTLTENAYGPADDAPTSNLGDMPQSQPEVTSGTVNADAKERFKAAFGQPWGANSSEVEFDLDPLDEGLI